MAKLEIIGFPQSTYTRVARMACEEKGVDYELKPAPPHSPEVNSIHPFGKIPAMRHGEYELCESKAIATYLDGTFNGPKLIPEDPRAAAETEKWVSIVNTMVDPVWIRRYLFGYIFPKTADCKPDRAMIDAAVPEMRKQADILDRGLARGSFSGNGYSFADINLMPILSYVVNFPEGKEIVDGSKNLKAFYEKNAQRASFKNTVPPPPPPRN
ncbi:MAG: glutathione S-transferase family protein [Xanthobacteraceae bacterium]